MIGNILQKLFGSKSDRDIKKLMPLVDEVKAAEPAIKALNDDELRGKTLEFKERIAEAAKTENDRIKTLEEELTADLSIEEKEQKYEEIDSLKVEAYKKEEEVLNLIKGEAFAVVKETARRLAENGSLKVKVSDKDREFAEITDAVEIDGDTAIWKNNWSAANISITWDMVHYDVQLIGGGVIHSGSIAEMATGEGKTLVATLPVYLNALPGRGVHLVTVNDYLARRDSEWMGPLYQFHGLSVDCIDKHKPSSDERRKAYQADITFGTNNEFGFDYLRDNMAHSPEDLVQRPHNFAIVDEVDSVLIDDARTPLIISGPTPSGDRHEFNELKPHIVKLVDAQKTIVIKELKEAKELIKAGDTKLGGERLLRAHRGFPKSKAIIKFLSSDGMRALLQKTENKFMEQQSKDMHIIDDELYFTIDEKQNQIDLTDKGVDLLSENTDRDFFLMPDISKLLGDLEAEELDSLDRAKKKEEIMRDFSIKSERIHTMNQLLKAYSLFEKDVEYVLMDNSVKIVDEQTGRIMDGRRYSDGLHQAIEAKENVKIEAATQTYATITLQNYFRMYNKLSGMTGTAETEAGEFFDIYELEVTVIPTNRPIARDDRQDLVYKTKREKYNAVIEEIQSLVDASRPVLVGTTSVEISELLGRALKLRKIKHNVLNAKLHQKEADIVAEAGRPGTVTIATNMAGRGTDIKLSPEAKAAGGLAIIGTERHDSRRVDRQLRGRAGRQGDVGSSQFFVSLEDNLMRLFGSERVASLMDRMGLKEGEVIQHGMVSKSIERAQKKVEENNFGVRKKLLEYDDVMSSQREVIYKARKHALYGDRLQLDIANMFYETIESLLEEYHTAKDFGGFQLEWMRTFALELSLAEEEFNKSKAEDLQASLYQNVMKEYELKNDRIAQMAMPVIKDVFDKQADKFENIVVPLTDGQKAIQVVTNLKKASSSEGKQLLRDLEKSIVLSFIDDSWKEHLRDMDDLRQTVQGAVYEQKDPLLIYKFEAFNLFKSMRDKSNKEVVSFLFKAQLPNSEGTQLQKAPERKKVSYDNLQTSHPDANEASSPSGSAGQAQAKPQRPKAQPMVSEKRYGRNDLVKLKKLGTGEVQEMKYKKAEALVASQQWILID